MLIIFPSENAPVGSRHAKDKEIIFPSIVLFFFLKNSIDVDAHIYTRTYTHHYENIHAYPISVSTSRILS